MTERDVIRKCIKAHGYTQTKLATEMGYKAPNSVAQALRQTGSMRVDVVLKYLDVLGFELVVRDKNTDNEWRIDYNEGRMKS